jgi:hypothetical protein
MDEGRGLSLRELVLEVRADVKSLDEKIEKIDRQGSIGTREDLTDHETRIRTLERFRYGAPGTAVLGVILAAVAIVIPHI